ncbi:YfgM family protein [Polyangium aurulentum]|uniref:YfgM family protein n=1 Tax=Polyangium aurulentum TaxID=2567896 RepID=UPI0010AE445D|nr:tetratricopeptide repeat protein [Polyangium aurulentum]UQA56508.1 tetratricopeptide repeat protein [Polyangium aurulentum]
MSREDKQPEEDRAKREDEDAREAEGSEKEGASDEAAQRIAASLGVSEEDARAAEEGGAEGEAEAQAEEEEAAKPNRALRRRDEALARRKKRTGGGAVAAEEPVEALPRDKNARAKELLKRRREQAAAAERKAPSQLAAGEMVDDALARTASATTKWLKENFQVLQWVILAGLVGVGGFLFYNSQAEKKSGNASSLLASAVMADQGRVAAEDPRSEEQKEFDPTRYFKTPEERADAALKAYGQVVEQFGGSGAALLAKLGQAGVFLQKREYDRAIEAYSAVLASPLAAADPDVKGRATEGLGFAKEGKGDLDGALASFKELGGIDITGYKDLSIYHQARLLFAKGDKDKAKELLKPSYDKFSVPAKEPQPLEFVAAAVRDLYTRIDPAAAQAPQFGGGAAPIQMDPAELQERARKAIEEATKKSQQSGGTP